mmetsp:Transcript_9658/g.11897  ORF Transcript_9658/g.11897 Transcript_9658/m.11897 type:complete len:239 (+) Transcript_9658:195-911(+)
MLNGKFDKENAGILVPALGVIVALLALCACLGSKCCRSSSSNTGSAPKYDKVPTIEPKSTDLEDPAKLDQVMAQRSQRDRRSEQSKRESLRGTRGGNIQKPEEQRSLVANEANNDDDDDGMEFEREPVTFNPVIKNKAPPTQPKKDDNDPFEQIGIAAKPQTFSTSRPTRQNLQPSKQPPPVRGKEKPKIISTKKPSVSSSLPKSTTSSTKHTAPSASALMDVSAWDDDDDLDDILNS